jgi:uncharacterized protein YjbI with pentapeptide repeats
MPELTADQILKKLKTGEKVERADLRGLALPKANLEGASFRRCDLDGANLEGAKLGKSILKNTSLREAYLAGADLRESNMESADLEGANLQNANLAGANLNRANLEGANLQGAKLNGARLTNAMLDSANLGGANLTGAILGRADLAEADLSTAILEEADLSSANLALANLEEAKMSRAQLRDAELRDANLKKAKLTAAICVSADFGGANLTDAELDEADVRRASFLGAKLDGVTVNGARVGAVIGTGKAIERLRGDWVDTSTEGDGSRKASGSEVTLILSGLAEQGPPAKKRYFGRGDVMRNAHLEFDSGAAVEVESTFEQCSISLGEGAELVVGKHGVLSGCQIKGAGRITINGKFVERESPGIAGCTQLVVTSGGSLVGAVEQPPEWTRFAFEPGCVLRMKITQKGNGNNNGEKTERKRGRAQP